jgi:hypothetical protein
MDMNGSSAIDLLQREISNPDTQWSLGTFGAIAEFSRDHDEQVRLVQSAEAVSAVTPRGSIALTPHAAIRPFASEGITKAGWNQRIALCLPRDDCAMNQRVALTEIGPDHQAPRERDREAILFDLGLGALQADFCVRIGDRNLATRLRDHAGRIEVYQPIPPPSGRSPGGPHTHVLPRLLQSRRTHPATEPVPQGWIPCAHLYPPHPARDGLGEARPFDATHHHAFQRMMAACGDPAALATKRRVVAAVLAGEPPTAVAGDRHGRISVRIALRQIKSQGHASAALRAWLASFDQAALDEADDEAALQHEA